MSDEYLGEKDGKRCWLTKTKTNHLADGEKLQRVLSGKIEERLDALRLEYLEKKKDAGAGRANASPRR